MEKAHYHATKAQEYEATNDFENAISHYHLAAQHYLEAVEYTTDANVQNTLRRCHFKALNDAKILQKKLRNFTVPMERSDSSSQIEDMAKFSGFVGQASSEEIGIFKLKHQYSNNQKSGPAQIKIDESMINSRSGMGNSKDMDSFNAYVLPNASYQTDDQAWVQDDPFVRFWDKVENLVEYFPLNLKKSDKSDAKQLPSTSSSRKKIHDDLSNQLLQSYYFVPSKTDRGSQKGLEEYEIENKALKETIHQLSVQVSSLENAAKENNLLKSSINQFREDIVKQRLQSRSPNLNLSTENELIKMDKSVLVQKVLDLEMQVHNLQKENLRLSKLKDNRVTREINNTRTFDATSNLIGLPSSNLGQSPDSHDVSQSVYTATSSGIYHSTNMEKD